MATTTPNFGWPVPTSTDLVKDGATAIEALGDSIDASLLDLKGGTTGQVLAKASGTDMDFSWVAQDDSNAIQNTIVDAKGDLIAATAADTPARLAVGANDTVLTADSSTATGLKWAAPASGGGMTLLSTTTLTGASTTVSTINGSYNDLIIYAKDWYASAAFNFLVTVNGDFTASNYQSWYAGSVNGNTVTTYGENNNVGFTVDGIGSSTGANVDNFAVIYIPNYANATTRKVFTCTSGYVNATGKSICNVSTYYSGTAAAISSMRFLTTVGTWSSGSIEIYGVK